MQYKYAFSRASFHVMSILLVQGLTTHSMPNLLVRHRSVTSCKVWIVQKPSPYSGKQETLRRKEWPEKECALQHLVCSNQGITGEGIS